MKPKHGAVALACALSLSAIATAQTVEGGGGGAPGGGGDNCGNVVLDDCGGSAWTSDHKVTGDGARFGKHTYCGVCVEDPGSGPPYFELDPVDCHPECFDENDDLLSLAAFASVREAARAGDLAGLIAVAPLAARYVRVNHARQSIQVLSCNGSSVIANMPVRDTRILAALAARVAPSSRVSKTVAALASLALN